MVRSVIISFGWTTPALLAGHKTVTRREWAPAHAAHFEAGDIVDAWNASPRVIHKQPHRVAQIKLTAAPRLESTGWADLADWFAEGFDYLTEQGARVGKFTPRELWRRWHVEPRDLYVVRFEVVNLYEGPLFDGFVDPNAERT